MESPAVDFSTLISSFFAPANTEDANLKLTTKEIAEKISEHYGSKVTVSDVHTKLTELGFIAMPDADLDVYWLLKSKI